MKKSAFSFTSRALASAITAVAALYAPVVVAQEAVQPIKIGVLTPLSPPGDPAGGQLIVRGAELAAEYINKRVGSEWSTRCSIPGQLSIAQADDSGLPEKGISGFRALVANERIKGVLGFYDSSVALAVQPLSEQLKIPMMITQASSDRISASRARYTFQGHTLAGDRSDTVTRFIEAYRYKKVAILAENTDYGTTSGPDMEKRLAASGIESKLWIFDRANPDLLSTLLQVKNYAPDVIYNMGVGAPAYLVAKQASDVGLLPATKMIISYDLPIRPEFWRNLGAIGNGMIFLSYYQPNQILTDAGRWMQNAYQQKYGEPALYGSFAAFGNVIQLAQAMNTACSTDADKMVPVLETKKLKSWNSDAVTFPQADGTNWHRFVQPTMVLQYTATGQSFADATILYPLDMKNGELRR